MRPRGRGTGRGTVVRAFAGAGLALVVGGCSAFLGPGFDGDFPSSSPIASYSTGTATIAIKGGETIKLETVAKGSGVESLFGSQVRWTGSNGWHLRVTGGGGDKSFGADRSSVSFDRIVDGQHWTSFDDGRCIVDVEVVDAKAIRGSATCKGVTWYDALDMPMTPGGPKELDEPKFDAEVTFEAIP